MKHIEHQLTYINRIQPHMTKTSNVIHSLFYKGSQPKLFKYVSHYDSKINNPSVIISVFDDSKINNPSVIISVFVQKMNKLHLEIRFDSFRSNELTFKGKDL
jgi:hypothetical protein